MAEERPLLPPPPTSTDDAEIAGQAAQGTPVESRPVKGRSLFGFFGKKGQSSTMGQVEQDSGVARMSSKERGVTSDFEDQPTRTLENDPANAAPMDGDTSANSITIVEPTGSKRKAAPTSTMSGRKRAQGKKVTDEDAELKAMEAAAKKKQKASAKAVGKKGKRGLIGDDGDQEECAVGKSRSAVSAGMSRPNGTPHSWTVYASIHRTEETRTTAKTATSSSIPRNHRHILSRQTQTKRCTSHHETQTEIESQESVQDTGRGGLHGHRRGRRGVGRQAFADGFAIIVDPFAER